MSSLGIVGATVFVILIGAAAPLHAAEGGDLARVVNFAIVAAVLFLALRKPVSGYLEARTEQIRTELEEAKIKRARAEEELAHAKALLAGLDEEVEKAKRAAIEAAEAEKTRILKAAEEEARRIREIARKEIDSEVEAGRRRLLARAAELSVSLAQEKLSTAMTEEDQKRLIDRSIHMVGKAPA